MHGPKNVNSAGYFSNYMTEIQNINKIIAYYNSENQYCSYNSVKIIFC
jgi:hypothetical protein